MFSRYLLDSTPPRKIVERYINASHSLGIINAVNKADLNILKFSRNHPWSISFLDAACGFLYPGALLRKKIYTMAAVLEASPLYTGYFLPQNLSSLRLFVQLITNGLIAGIKVMIGIPIFLYVRRRSHG